MTIAFCDDMIDTVNEFINITRDYFNSKGVPIQIATYTHATELLKDATNGILYDIYFLDYEMPDISGEELAIKLRRFAPNSIIGYTSMYDDIGTSACRADCDMYLYKSYSSDMIVPELERVYKKLLRFRTAYTFLTPNGKKRQVLVRDIQYIESLHRYLYVHLIDEVFEIAGRTLKEYERYVEFADFVRISKSFFINKNNIVELYFKRDHFALMKNGKKLKITYKNFQEF